jgi:phosphoenolpyruvate---glycerone phosphotransferase subunit DhaK
VRADAPVQGKVALATGGGSGHLPVFLGYVGQGMLDGCAVGDVFASPSAEQMLAVTRRIHGGKGVLYIYGNYGGDVMNFDMAAEMADMEDIEVRTVLVKDDVASAPPEEAGRRRGVAGMVFAFKCAGAKADMGGDLDEVAAIAPRRRWPTPARWAWRCRPAPCRRRASRPSPSARRDGDRHGHPRRAGHEARAAADGRQITERMMDAPGRPAPAAGDRVA